MDYIGRIQVSKLYRQRINSGLGNGGTHSWRRSETMGSEITLLKVEVLKRKGKSDSYDRVALSLLSLSLFKVHCIISYKG